MREDTAHFEEEDAATDNIKELTADNDSAINVPEKEAVNSTVSEIVKYNMALNPLAPPTSGKIETSTDPPKGS